jgi:hypothetical protein
LKNALILVATAIVATAASESWACGACAEDLVAVTYDHAIIDTAKAKHQQVVFVAVDGPTDARKVNARIVAAASKVRGVQAGTLRTSLAPRTFSFALDGTQEPRGAVAGFSKAIGDPSTHLTLVRIMRDGVLIEPN